MQTNLNSNWENKELLPADLDKLFLDEARKIHYHVHPAVKDVPKKMNRYTPKPYGTKRTYPQDDWSLYAKACSREKLMFFKLLKDAVETLLIDYEYKGNGRPPVFYGDIVKAICIGAYSGYSSWRVESELRIARSMGIIDIVHKKSTINKYMQSKKVKTLLELLYKVVAEPLSEVETHFAADATGFGNRYGNIHWSKVRHTKIEKKARREYTKLNIITGCKTNIVCSAIITKGTVHESPYFQALLDDTAKMFNIKDISADAGYLSKDNVKAAVRIGAMPFIMPKKNVNVPQYGSSSAWGTMLNLWKHHQMFFAEFYHRRSNVESTFSALKRKFGGYCRTRKEQSQENEILAKIVCYNIVILAKGLLSYNLKKGFIAS